MQEKTKPEQHYTAPCDMFQDHDYGVDVAFCCLPGCKHHVHGAASKPVSAPERLRRVPSSASTISSTPSTLRQMSASLQNQSGYDLSVESLFR